MGARKIKRKGRGVLEGVGSEHYTSCILFAVFISPNKFRLIGVLRIRIKTF